MDPSDILCWVCVPLSVVALTDAGWWWRSTILTTCCVAMTAFYNAWDLVSELYYVVVGAGSRAYDLLRSLCGVIAYGVFGWCLGLAHIYLCLALITEITTPLHHARNRAIMQDASKYATAQRSHHQLAASIPIVPPRPSYRPPEKPLPHNPHNIAPINGPLKFDEQRNRYYYGRSLDDGMNNFNRSRVAGLAFYTAFFLVRIVWHPIHAWWNIRPLIVEGLATDHSFIPAAIALADLSASIASDFYWLTLILCAPY